MRPVSYAEFEPTPTIPLWSAGVSSRRGTSQSSLRVVSVELERFYEVYEFPSGNPQSGTGYVGSRVRKFGSTHCHTPQTSKEGCGVNFFDDNFCEKY